MDDILIIGSNSSLITELITKLSSTFAHKDLGELHYLLGIEVLHAPKGVILSQAKYALDLLTKAGMLNCRPYDSSSSLKLVNPDDTTLMAQPKLYRSLVGSLQYLTLTRPEISYAANSVCQQMHHPLECHSTAMKQILRYVKGTLG